MGRALKEEELRIRNRMFEKGQMIQRFRRGRGVRVKRKRKKGEDKNKKTGREKTEVRTGERGEK